MVAWARKENICLCRRYINTGPSKQLDLSTSSMTDNSESIDLQELDANLIGISFLLALPCLAADRERYRQRHAIVRSAAAGSVGAS